MMDSSHIFSHDFVKVSEVLSFLKIILMVFKVVGQLAGIVLMPLLIAENEDLCETEQCRV